MPYQALTERALVKKQWSRPKFKDSQYPPFTSQGLLFSCSSLLFLSRKDRIDALQDP